MRPLALLVGLMVSTPAAADVAVALVIGNNASPPGDEALAPLRYADDDALRFQALLGLVADDVRTLVVLDEETQRRYPSAAATLTPPTRAELDAAVRAQAALVAQARARGATTSAYLYFSGHGSTREDGEPYLALLDDELTGPALYSEIVDAIGADRTHLIVDACNAGAVVGARGRFDNQRQAEEVALSDAALEKLAARRDLKARPTVGAIVAASAGQETHEWSRIESGVFSHEVLSALLGPGDVNGDGRVEYSEVQAFISAANSQVEDPRARPTVIARAPAIDQRAPLLRLDGLRAARLRGDLGGLGRFHVELANGQRYLDANLTAGGRATVVLPADTRVFLRTERSEVALQGAAGEDVELGALVLRPRQLASRGAVDESYRRFLFAEPYGRTYYQGFVDSRALVPVAFEGGRPAPAAPGWGAAQIGAVSSWGAAGALALTAGVTGALALQAQAAFNETDVQREAAELSAQYAALGTTTWILVGGAVVATGAGALLWPWAGPDSDDVTEDTGSGTDP